MLQPIVEVIYAPLEGAFPGLMAAIEREGERPFWSEPDETWERYGEPLGLGAYNAFIEVAKARVYDPVLRGTASSQQVEAFFRWLEWMALSDDRQIVFFMQTELCETIGNNRDDTQRALPLMGLRSLECFLEIERQWGTPVVLRIEAEIETRLT